MADYSNISKHDIKITDPSTGNVIGFNVDRDDNGLPAYFEYSGKALADYVSSSEPTQVSTNPEEELILGQYNWKAGFGKEYYDSGDPKRYFQSYGCDLRNDCGPMAGWSSTALTIPDLPTITDSGLELWDDANTLTNYTFEGSAPGGTYTLTQEGTIKLTGTYSAKINIADAAGGASDYARFYQDAVTWTNDWRGITIGIRVGVYNEDVTKVRGDIIIDDGIDTTTASSVGSGAWERIYCLHKLNAAATRLRIYCKATGIADLIDSDVYFDVIEFPETGVCDSHAEFDSDLFFNKGNFLFRLNESTGVLTLQGGIFKPITCLEPMNISGSDYLFICTNYSYTYFYMTTAEVFTMSTAATKTFLYMKLVHTTVDTMYGTDTNNTIRSTINPLNAGTAWSDQTIVGADNYDIQGLHDYNGALLIEKEDMPYYLDSSGNVQNDLAPECKSGTSTTSGKYSDFWLGDYFRPTGDQALLRAGTSNEWIQPSKFTTNNTEFVGKINAVCGDEENLYAITDSGSSIMVQSGKEEIIDDVSRWTWHPIHYLSSGDTSTEILRPTSAGDESNLTPTAGANYTNVDDVAADDATTTVSTSALVTWKRDLYNLNNTAITDTIEKITITVRCKTSASNASAKICIKTGGTAYEGSIFWIDTTWTNYTADWAINPDTGIAWVAADINALQIGVSLAAGFNTAYCTQVYLTTTYYSGYNCETAFISNVYQKRLYITSSSSTGNIYYLPLPTKYGDILHDDNRSFLTGTYFVTPWLHGNFEAINKCMTKFTCFLGHTYDAAVYWTVYYQGRGDTAWNLIGNFDGTLTDRNESIYLTSTPTSNVFRYKFVAVTDSTNLTPILRGYSATTILYPPKKTIISTRVKVDRGSVNLEGQPASLYELQKTCIANCLDATAPVTMVEYITDKHGVTHYVKFLPVTDRPLLTPYEKEKGMDAEIKYSLMLMDVPLS